MSKFVETNYTSTREILKFPDHYVAIAVTVSDEGIEVNEYGKKVIPAGTIVGGKSKPVLLNEDEVVVRKNTQGTDANEAEGVLFYDVDVTYGAKEAAMLIHGFIAIDKLPEAPAVDAVTALKQISFIK
ncbi:hypothetical protein [Clostridium formicaceticum]|uniref:Head decoration protein n=1 Tax=Clostridium formicaceticum TaxID=1497 RepID=A0AAC9WFR0_9CLOT|nr:hypothetical protein [Clostridium formicaceticum]AOY76740.1 hypothetical protein BJL90_13200 [Clostridium formicaceticum]ARE87177.1 hypothetical protein CLFO_15650 [Clostridium formicaceticum]